MMKRKLLVSVVIILIIAASTTLCFAATTNQTECADALYDLGLFNGTGRNTDGTPIYSLDKEPTRAEAITMLVNLLGKAGEACATEWDMPFTDVPTWAKPYVGYAYNNKLTAGVSETLFGSAEKATETQYCTFVLRALGYDGNDFRWDEARLMTDTLGITSVDDKTTKFTRGNVVEISYNALSATMKNSDINLLNSLYKNGAVSVNEVPKLFSQVVAEMDTSKVPVGDSNINAYLLALDPSSYSTELNETHLTHFCYDDMTIYSKICTYFDSQTKTLKKVTSNHEQTHELNLDFVRVELNVLEGRAQYMIEKFETENSLLTTSFYYVINK